MYNVIYLDACGRDGKPRTHRINQIGPNDFILSGTIQKFTSLAHLRKTYRDAEGQLYLGECIPASENGIFPINSRDIHLNININKN